MCCGGFFMEPKEQTLNAMLSNQWLGIGLLVQITNYPFVILCFQWIRLEFFSSVSYLS
jgi:hypothetical protein